MDVGVSMTKASAAVAAAFERWMTPAPPGAVVAWWRLLLGLSIAGFSAHLWPYLDELFTTRGVVVVDTLAVGGLSSSTVIHLLWCVVIVSALCIAGGVVVAPAAGLCWLSLMLAYKTNTLSRSPEMPLVHLSLLLLAICPLAAPRIPWRALRSSTPPVGLPPVARVIAWAAFAVVYGTSGLTKLTYNDSSWLDGSALYHVLNHSTFRYLWYGDFFSEPSVALQVGTHLSLMLEAGAPLFVWFYRGRCLVWVMSMTMHIIAIVLLNLLEVSVHMITFHILLVDERMIIDAQTWWRRLRRRARGARADVAAAPDRMT
jgi:hypothetical protein